MRVVKAPLQGLKAHGAWTANRRFAEVAGAPGGSVIATASRFIRDAERVHTPAGGGA